MCPMGKLLMTVVVLAALGAAGYFAWTRFMAPASSRACAKLADTCGLGDDGVDACKKVLDEAREASGNEAAAKLAKCLTEAGSCTEAAGCAAGSGLGMLSRSMLEFLDGLRQGN